METQLQLLAAADEECPLAAVSRIIPCDPAAWAGECPEPPGWRAGPGDRPNQEDR